MGSPILALPIVGVLTGLLTITLGGGGGAIYVGILTVFFHVPPAIAASTSLATMIPTTAMGAFSHGKVGHMNIRLGLYMLGGGVPGAIIGSVCSTLLPDRVYDTISGLFIVAISIQMLGHFLRRKPQPADRVPSLRLQRSHIIQAVIYGLFGGALAGLVGISGSPAIVAGLSVLGCDVMEIAGTSVLVLLGVALTGFLMHLSHGTIDWPLVGLFLIGTLSGAWLGPKMLTRLNPATLEKVLRPIFFVLMIGTGTVLALK